MFAVPWAKYLEVFEVVWSCHISKQIMKSVTVLCVCRKDAVTQQAQPEIAPTSGPSPQIDLRKVAAKAAFSLKTRGWAIVEDVLSR